MTKQLTLLIAFFSLLSTQIYAQNEPSSNESKTNVFKYKLKLSPIDLSNKIELEYYLQNVANEDLYESTVGNFNFDIGFLTERNTGLINSLIADSLNGEKDKMIEDYKKSTLKSISFDSAKIEVYQNSEFNYSSISINGDTLIGIKKQNEPLIEYYYISRKGNFIVKTEMGSLISLHSSQSMFSNQDLPIQILNHNTSLRKVKFMNKMYASAALLTNEINEIDNLIYNFQYPSDPNNFPLQFNLFKNNNKYCFELVSEKIIPNSKAINKKIKLLNERKFEKMQLNDLFQLVGFEY